MHADQQTNNCPAKQPNMCCRLRLDRLDWLDRLTLHINLFNCVWLPPKQFMMLREQHPPDRPVYVGTHDLVFSAMPCKSLANNQMYANPHIAELLGKNLIDLVLVDQPADLDTITVQCSFIRPDSPNDAKHAASQIKKWLGTHSYNTVLNVGQTFDIQMGQCKVVSTILSSDAQPGTKPGTKPGCVVWSTHVVVIQ